jgi:hypothetical protein
MRDRVNERYDWVSRHEGSLTREELLRLAESLGQLPAGARSVLLDWLDVTHLDFRGLRPLVDRLSALALRGVVIRVQGLDPYLFSILRLSAGDEEIESFLGDAERAECAAARGRDPREAGASRWLLAVELSEN